MAEYPKPLTALLERIRNAVAEATDRLEADPSEVAQWQQTMEDLLTRYHAAAYMAGQGSETLDAAGKKVVAREVEAQLGFLDNFVVQIQNAAQFQRGWKARADLYAESVKGSFWRGKTKLLPLPAMPTEGTQCLTRCGCSWVVTEIDGENGDWDATWRLGKDDNCTTCEERAKQWAPLRIRGGELQ